jgi:hypothetical protein
MIGRIDAEALPDRGQCRQHRIDTERGQRHHRCDEGDEFGETERRLVLRLRCEVRLFHAAQMAHPCRYVTPLLRRRSASVSVLY